MNGKVDKWTSSRSTRSSAHCALVSVHRRSITTYLFNWHAVQRIHHIVFKCNIIAVLSHDCVCLFWMSYKPKLPKQAAGHELYVYYIVIDEWRVYTICNAKTHARDRHVRTDSRTTKLLQKIISECIRVAVVTTSTECHTHYAYVQKYNKIIAIKYHIYFSFPMATMDIRIFIHARPQFAKTFHMIWFRKKSDTRYTQSSIFPTDQSHSVKCTRLCWKNVV